MAKLSGLLTSAPAETKIRTPGKTGELYAIYLRPEAKGVGAGRSLFNQGKAWATEHGFTELTTLVLEANKGACDFYIQMGMIEDGMKIPDRIGGQDVVEIRYAMRLG